MTEIDAHIQAAEATVQSNPEQSTAWSLLTMVKMIKAATDRDTQLEAQQERFDKQDGVLGNLSVQLREAAENAARAGEYGAERELRRIITMAEL